MDVPHAGNRSARSRVRSNPFAVLTLAALLVAGCSNIDQWWHNGLVSKSWPAYKPLPGAPVAADWTAAAYPRIVTAPADDCAWWTVFHDPALNGLIETAYRQNLDLRIAGTRILEARAERNIAAGNLFPQSQNAVGGYAHGQVSRNLALPLPSTVNAWATGFNASWELDFWGRFRRLVEAGDATLDASVEGYHDALVLLLSEVANNYIELRTFETRLQFARRNVEIQRGSLGLAEERFKKGSATELDVSQARANLEQTEALVPPLEIGRRRASDRLCVLLGMPVSDLACTLPPAPIPQAPLELAVGIPADLLGRRPDIRRAERQVAAECARMGVAEADLYPQFGVSGFLGYAAGDLRQLFESKSFTAFILPSFEWKILNYGRVVNSIHSQDARYRRAALEYQQTVLNAGQEVEDALVGFVQTQQQARHLDASVRESGRAVELATDQFEGGLADFNRVFTTQTAMVNAQDQLAIARGNIALQLVAAYTALGGGWQFFCAGSETPGLVIGAPNPPVDLRSEPVAPPPPRQGEEIPAPGNVQPGK